MARTYQGKAKADLASEDAQFFRDVREKSLYLTQQQLADLIGVEQMTLYRWEANILPLKKIHWLALIGLMAIDKQDFEPILKFLEAYNQKPIIPQRAVNIFDMPPPDDEEMGSPPETT